MRIAAILRRRARAFAAAKHGSAAIEFAFIAPILILFYFATIELSLALEAKRKVTSTASTIGDLVAQTEQINTAEIDAIFEAADAIMQPLDVSAMELRVTSLVVNADGDAVVKWSRASNMTAYACGAEVDPPEGVLTPGQSIIVAETAFIYTPPIGNYLTGDIALKDTFFLRPRLSIEVDYLPDPCPGV